MPTDLNALFAEMEAERLADPEAFAATYGQKAGPAEVEASRRADPATRCGRCGGRGVLPEYWRIEGGKCFTCNGAGVRR